MGGKEFLMVQYEALRQEILATQRRNLQTLGFGALSIPAAGFLAETKNVPALWLTVPVLILGIALLYLADNHGIIRCGAYIKEHIEKPLREEGIIGWETWLEEGHGKRSTERYTTWCFYLFFILYFVASVLMAWSYMEPGPSEPNGPAKAGYPVPVAVGIMSFYCVLGAGLAYHVVRSIRLGTSRYIESHTDSARRKDVK